MAWDYGTYAVEFRAGVAGRNNIPRREAEVWANLGYVVRSNQRPLTTLVADRYVLGQIARHLQHEDSK